MEHGVDRRRENLSIADEIVVLILDGGGRSAGRDFIVIRRNGFF